MLSKIFNKEAKKVDPTPAPQPPVFEIGKEHTHRDPKTGEFVYQRAISPEHRKAIGMAMQKNAATVNDIIGIFRNFMAVMDAAVKINSNISISEKEINESVKKARDEYKLDGRWLLNPQLMILEKRSAGGLMQSSEDIPFVLHGGADPSSAAINRVNAINRINYLVRQKIPDFDIRTKSEAYKKCLDLELYKKYYTNEPQDKKIDEEFCQRASQICIDMDKVDPVVDNAEFTQAVNKAQVPENKENFIARFFKKK